MNEAPHQRIIRLAELCADLSPEERREFLLRECGADLDLRQSVEFSLSSDPASEPTQAFANDYERALPDHYQLVRLLGRGGMAEVFLAEDRRLGRRVAIKFLSSEFSRDPERLQRFNREARAASALNHPNILTIHDIGGNDTVQFIVSEYVEGETLGSRILRGRLSLPEAVHIAAQIASALVASHQAGIVHRDLKPDNVMVRRDGSVKVLDFGLAKETGSGFANGSDPDARTLARVSTSPGLILGTPQYMSPEQARGLELDARTDIFSLGIILFEMASGRPPFQGNSTADTIAAIVGKEPRDLEEILQDPPPMLPRIVHKALRKGREERYSTMDHLLSDLRDLQKELSEADYDPRPTGGTEARATLNHTIRTFLDSRLIHSRWSLAVPVILMAAVAGWWYSGSNSPAASNPPGTLRSVPVATWNSGPREMVATGSFSSDAKMVAYSATLGDSTEIFVKPTEGGDPVQVTKNGFQNRYPVWSPNDREVAFLSNRGSSRGIWRAAFTGGGQIQIASEVGGSARLICWSKEGKIYFQEGPELYSLDESTGQKELVTNFQETGAAPRTIEMDREASSIAYTVREGDDWKLRVKRLDSADVSDLASSRFQIDHFAWRPDGRSVIFSNSVDGLYQAFEAGIGQTAPVQLSNGSSDVFVQDVSADGSKILFSSVSETSDVWTVNTETLKESVAANDVAAEYWADISAGGMVFQSVGKVDRPYSGSVTVKSGGPPVMVSPSGFGPVWSNNGRWIAYFKRVDSGMEIWRVNPDGVDARKLAEGALNAPGYTPTPYLKIGVNHISWSPDDEYIAYSARIDGISNIWLASADGTRRSAATDNSDNTAILCCAEFVTDGSGIVFQSDHPSQSGAERPSYRLWFRRLDGSRPRVVYESNERFRFLGLSSGGKAAVLAQIASQPDPSSAPASTAVYLVSLDTGARRESNRLEDAYFHNIHLSRDGTSIAFVSRRDNETALWTVPVSGSEPRRLLVENDPKVMLSSLSWSPDGRSIAFGRQTRTNLLSMLAR